MACNLSPGSFGSPFGCSLFSWVQGFLVNTAMPTPSKTQSRSDNSFCQFQPDATSLSTVAAALEVRRRVSAFGSVSSSVGFGFPAFWDGFGF